MKQFKKYPNTHMAKLAAKNHYGACIFTNAMIGHDVIAGAHILPAGVYSSVKCYRENIIPIVFGKHTTGDNTLDWVLFGKQERDDFEKVIYIYDNILPEFRQKFTQQMFDLIDILRIKKLNLAADNFDRLMETYI